MSSDSSFSMLAKRCIACCGDLRSQVGGQLGVHRAGLDEGDADVPAGDLLAQRLAEGADAVLGEVVDPRALARHPPGHGADVDQVRHAPWRTLRRLEQVRERGVGGVEQPEHVQVDHPLPLLDRRVHDGAEEHDAGVVDHGVEPSPFRHGALHGGDGLLPVGDVRFEGEGAPAVRGDLRGELVQPVLAPRHEGDRRRRAPASARAVASPMPLLAPVTSATVPSSDRAMGFSLSEGKNKKGLKGLQGLQGQETPDCLVPLSLRSLQSFGSLFSPLGS